MLGSDKQILSQVGKFSDKEIMNIKKLNKGIWDKVGKFTDKKNINIKKILINVESSEYTIYSMLEEKTIEIENPEF